MRSITGAFLFILTLFILIIVPGYLSEKTDVIIIGAGAAGMRAAIESRNYTDRIILLEKMSYPGGNSNKASAGFNAVRDPEDLESFINDTMEAGGYQGKEELIRVMGEGSPEALSDMRQMGADLEDLGLLAGHSRSRTYRPSGGSPVGKEISSILYTTIADRNIDIRVDNRALSIQRRGKKLMVLVMNQTGKEYSIKADSVIIATGGFGGSQELVARFNPALGAFPTTNSAGATGDFLTLSEKLPVMTIDLGEIQTHPTVEPDFSILITEALRGNGGILLNSNAQRFTDEMDFREELSESILNQTDGFAWLVFDQRVRNSLRSSEYYIGNHLSREGRSLPELAQKMSVPADNLSSSMERWNLFVQDGRDLDFERKDLRIPLIEPPYFAIRVSPGIHYCMGGIAIDERSRVLDKDGNVIEGLYAAGEATGGIHGKDRLGGNSLTDALVFGKIAGYEAAYHALQ